MQTVFDVFVFVFVCFLMGMEENTVVAYQVHEAVFIALLEIGHLMPQM